MRDLKNNYDAMAFPKESWKKKRSRRNSKKKVVMHPKESGYCFLCALLHGDYSYKYTEEHHVMFGAGQRETSDQYGLTVRLCCKHHKDGKEAVHNSQEIRELLCKKAQQWFAENYPEENWNELFRKNYL